MELGGDYAILTKNSDREPADQIKDNQTRAAGICKVSMLLRRVESDIVQQTFRPCDIAHTISALDSICRDVYLNQFRSIGQDGGRTRFRRAYIDKPQRPIRSDALRIGS